MIELEKFLPYRLSVLSNRVSQAVAQEYSARFKLSITEWRVVAVLGRGKPLSANEVADRTAMDKVAVSRAVSRLVKSGRLIQTFTADDRRRSELSLSDEGKQVFNEIAPIALSLEKTLLASLDEEELRWLERIMNKLQSEGVRALQKHISQPRK